MKRAWAGAIRIRAPLTWYGGEGPLANLAFRLLTHAGPDIGVDDVGPLDGGLRVGSEAKISARMSLPEPFDERNREFVAQRGGDGELHAQHATGDSQRAGDIVAIAHVGERFPLE